jgi:hypothetical protein
MTDVNRMTDVNKMTDVNRMDQQFGQIVNIKTMFYKRIIPAILRGNDRIIDGYYSVWIPDGYDGAGGFSARAMDEVYDFDGSDDIKKDVLKQWEDRQREPDWC